MSMVRSLSLMTALAALALGAPGAGAQTTCSQDTQAAFNTTAPCRVNHSIAATVPYLAQVTISSANQVSFGTVTAAQMNVGFTGTVAGPTLQIAANFTWSLSATAGSITAPADVTKSTNDLEFASNTTGTTPSTGFTGLGSAVSIATSQSAVGSSSTYHTFFRMKLAWASDKPGSYSSTVTYTLTAP
jgi:hypothetical protein